MLCFDGDAHRKIGMRKKKSAIIAGGFGMRISVE